MTGGPGQVATSDRWLLIRTAVIALVTTVACGEAPRPAPAAGSVTRSTSEDVRARLFEAAKQEGALVLWGPSTDTIAKYFPQEFQKAFPGISVTGIADNQAPARLVTEIRAGRFDADALWWPYTGVTALDDRGWLTEFLPEELSAFGLSKTDTDFDGRALKVANFVYGLMYDTRRLESGDLPVTWEDLTTPRWKQQIVGTTLTVPFLVAGIGLIKGDAWAVDYARALRAAEIAIVPDPLVALDMLVRGERSLALHSPAFTLERSQTFQDPVAWHAISPTIATQHAAVVINKGPHPNAAKLWALWAASREGQTAMDIGAFEVSARPGAPTRQAKMLESSGVEVVFETPEMVKPRLALYNKVRPILFGEAR